MNEPVAVGIEFPRSGQHISVKVPQACAESLENLCAGLQSKGVVSLRLGNDRPTDVIEPLTRKQ